MRGREARMKAVEAQQEQRRLSREQFLEPRIREDEVDVAGLGGSVLLRGMTHGLRNDLRNQAKYGTPEYDDDLFTRLVMVHTIVDPQLTMEDVDALKDQDSVVFDELVLHINIFSLAGAAEALKKGSRQTPNEDTASSSQSA